MIKLLFWFTLLINLFAVQGCEAFTPAEKLLSPEKEVNNNSTRQNTELNTFVEGEVIVRFVESADGAVKERIISSIGGQIIKTVSVKRKTYLVKLPEDTSVHDAINELTKQNEVVYAEPNRVYELMRVE